MWSPSPERIADATISRYMHWVGSRGRVFADYDELWRWSVDEVGSFWESIWEFFDVQAVQPYEHPVLRGEMPNVDWFSGARLNWAAHLLRDRDPDTVAIVAASEDGATRELTWGELETLAGQIAAGLRRLGIGPGDRVVAYLPNIPEAVAALLACAAIGAVWSSGSPDFGSRSLVDRFAQIEPKLLFTVDGYRYGGRDFDRRDVVADLRAGLPTLEHVVLLPHLDLEARLEGTTPFAELTADSAPLRFESVAFDHPLWILYSSGTTGLPKGIVQGHGGILLEQLKSAHLHVDAQPGDRVFWFTTTGWMMWNYLIGCLLTGAGIVLYDGNPGHPGLDVLWDLAERTGITHFGTSASYLGSCAKAELRPRRGRELAALRAVGSTGSPLSPEGFRWVTEALGPGIWLFSASGGSDVCTAFVAGCPVLPVHVGEIQCRALGCKVEAYDEAGRSVLDEVGELVVTEPMPSMPLYLWSDPDGERYHDSYFSMYPGVWRHGDWIEITSRGTAIITGRSDSTINRGGVRMGTAEILSALLVLPEVTDALVVDVDGWMPLFVTLADGARLDQELVSRIRSRVREDCSPRHVPSEVLPTPEIPRTLTGKLLEVPVKRLLAGEPAEQVASRDALANPEAFDWFVAFARDRAAKRSAKPIVDR